MLIPSGTLQGFHWGMNAFYSYFKHAFLYEAQRADSPIIPDITEHPGERQITMSNKTDLFWIS